MSRFDPSWLSLLPKDITELDLSMQGINSSNSKEVFKALAEYKNLENLNLSDNELSDYFEVFAHLVIKTSRKLVKLSVDRCGLMPIHVKYFADAVVANPDNVLRIVSWNENITEDQGCKDWCTIVQNSRIDSLSLSRNKIGKCGGIELALGFHDHKEFQFKLLNFDYKDNPIKDHRNILDDIDALLKGRRNAEEKRKEDERRGIKRPDHRKIGSGPPQLFSRGNSPPPPRNGGAPLHMQHGRRPAS